jgi:uncharacterized integral membrane protein
MFYMKRTKMILLWILSLILVLLVVQNTAPVLAHFLWLKAEVPVILLLLLTAAGGFVSGILVALLIQSGAKQKPQKGELHE